MTHLVSAPLPNLICHSHATRFGGNRSDVIDIDFNYTPTPLNPGVFALTNIIECALPELQHDQLHQLLDLGSIYVTRIQLGSPEKQDCQKTNRWKKRYDNRIKKYNGEFSPNAPRLTHRLIFGKNEKLFLLPKATLSLRIHLLPQRFPLASYVDWKSRVTYMSDDIVIVDKPGGIPCQPVASNYKECVHVLAGKTLFNKPLFPTSRLDLWTTGVICLARNVLVVQKVNDWYRKNLVKKTYRALTYHVPSSNKNIFEQDIKMPFLLENWMPKGSRVTRAKMISVRLCFMLTFLFVLGTIFGLTSPKLLSRHFIPKWKHCLASILTISPLHFPDNFCVTPNEGKSLDYSKKMTEELHRLKSFNYKFYDVQIKLITGRTHQLRTQLSALGFPIVGDTMYYPLANIYVDHIAHERIATTDFSACILNGNVEAYHGEPLTEQEKIFLKYIMKTKAPIYPIGLQAQSVEFPSSDGIKKVSLASPWWLGGRH